MPRSTKIVATLGPASSDPMVLERMIRAGVDVVRLNFSHGTAADHEQRAALVKSIASKTGRTLAIMCDLQGPKIRVGRFKDGKITLEKGQRFVLDAACELGDSDRAGLDYKELPRDVEPGAVLLLDDGKIVLEVTAVKGSEVHTVVRHGGVLSNNKGINRQGGGLTAAALTAKDMEDIRTAVKIQADYLAVSFPKSGADMYMARELMRAAGGNAFLIAKIERAEAVSESALVDIMRGADGIMVARGDLAVEVGDAERKIPGGSGPGDGPNLHRGRADAAAQPRPGLLQPSVHAGGPVDRHGRPVHRLSPEGQGDRLAHRIGLDRAVDEPPQCRRTDLRAHRSDRHALSLRAFPRCLPADGE